MHNIILNVDGMAGGNINDVFEDMLSLSKKLDIMVTSDVKGFHAIAFSGKSIDAMNEEYNKYCIHSSEQYKKVKKDA